MSKNLKPGDLCQYAVPQVVKVISKTFFSVEVEFPDGSRRTVDESYLSERLDPLEGVADLDNQRLVDTNLRSHSRVEQRSAHVAHNHEVEGSNPSSATKET